MFPSLLLHLFWIGQVHRQSEAGKVSIFQVTITSYHRLRNKGRWKKIEWKLAQRLTSQLKTERRPRENSVHVKVK